MGCCVMVKPSGDEPLLVRIEAYLEQHGIPATRFSKLAVSSPSLVDRLRKGLTVRPGTKERIEAVLAYPPLRPTRGTVIANKYRKAMSDNVEAERVERDRRLSDPVERAATFMRQMRWMVCRASVVDGEEATGWIVGTVRLSDAELVARALSKGWRG